MNLELFAILTQGTLIEDDLLLELPRLESLVESRRLSLETIEKV